jgi:BlaI family transcriptional regulator, penicillinase repressor
MKHNVIHQLSRRERQIMDAIYRFGEVSAAEIQENIPDPPSYAAVRRLIAILEEKGYVQHRQDGPRYLYRPVEGIEKARKSAISHLTDTFFRGSTFKAVAAMLDLSSEDLTPEELEELARLIHKAKGEGR